MEHKPDVGFVVLDVRLDNIYITFDRCVYVQIDMLNKTYFTIYIQRENPPPNVNIHLLKIQIKINFVMYTRVITGNSNN